MVKIAIGVILAFLIGAGCRWFGIPVPAPATWIGAALVASITMGYLTADRLLPPASSDAEGTARVATPAVPDSAPAPSPADPSTPTPPPAPTDADRPEQPR